MAKYYTKKSSSQSDYYSKRESVKIEKNDGYESKSTKTAKKSNVGWIVFLMIVFGAVYYAMKYFVFK